MSPPNVNGTPPGAAARPNPLADWAGYGWPYRQAQEPSGQPGAPGFEYRDPPILTFTEWDRVYQVRAILKSFEYGNFQQAALLWDQMTRDDRISSCLNTRVQGLLGAELLVSPGKGKSAKEIAEDIGGSDEMPGAWAEMYGTDALAGLQKWGLGVGIGLAEMIWDTTGENAKPRLKVWHPQFIQWRWDTRSYWVITETGLVELPRTDRHVHSDGKWIIYTPYGYYYGWMRALIRPLAMLYISRQWLFRDWNRKNEVHGMPIRLALVPRNADDKDKDRFFDSVTNMAAEGVVEAPVDENGKGFGLELVESEANNSDTFELFAQRLDTAISVAILGHNMSTEVQSGALAAAQVGENIRADYRRFDAKSLAQTMRDQALFWYVRYNYGDGAEVPRVEFQVDPPEDELKEAQMLQALALALPGLAALGADVRAIMDRAGVPLLPEEEVAEIEETEPKPPGGGGPEVEGEPAPEEKTHALRAGKFKQISERRVYAGLPIAVENKAGSMRPWTAPDGRTGVTMMRYDYGFIEGHMGADGDEVDCYLGPDEHADQVHIVHQREAPDYKRFDEDKVMLGFRTPLEAKNAFLMHRDDGAAAFGGMSTMPLEVFKSKLKRRTGTGKIRAAAELGILEELVACKVVHRKDGWHVVSEDGGKHLGGPYDTKGEAVDRLRQVEYYKRHKASARVALGGRTRAGVKRAQRYADALAATARARGQMAMRVDLAEIRHAIEGAKSFDELKGRVVRAFRGMRPEHLARVMERTLIMAELHGRKDLLEDV